MDYLKVLEQTILTNKLNTKSLDGLLADLAALYSAHTTVVNTVHAIVEQQLGKTNALTECANCGSSTILGFGHCHLCGEALYEKVEDTPKKEAPVKEKTKPAKEKETPKKAVEVDLDDDLELDDIPVKEVKSKPAKKDDIDLDLEDDEPPKKPSKPAKEKASDKKAKEAKQDDLDDDFDLDLEEEEKPKKAKKTKAPVKEEIDEDFDKDEEVADIDSEFDDLDDFDLDL
jgi:hypothetical protein